eukprot:CAMPEP_0184498704 /NCGR_PEP_ID=MMETSP0113_2-20130426/39617_1 /TAXON_ID=91329 /ORGANISM="Norrisiella sphaerica, Strain BC52" /LENGTH=367 /DNA_ID=CAMNT_0026886329 /DNA_START=1 /DNA_END=1104 /DNA_ORIENTATION=-
MLRKVVGVQRRGLSYKSNITANIKEKMGRGLHRQHAHPLNTVKVMIEQYFEDRFKANDIENQFKFIDDMDPYVTTKQCFDELLVPADHVSRSLSDTFYKDENTVLRTHTSAHQQELMKKGFRCFLATGDCYRRDEIDSTHYPVFHQMEGVRIMGKDVSSEEVMVDLKDTLQGLVAHLFGSAETRWVDAYFPFTEPSLELEVYFREDWLEVLGCGQIQSQILVEAGYEGEKGWAFGIGLERLAMALFRIPDIRLFWSRDKRFLDQFEAGKVVEFKEFSKYPLCYKDISFWEPESFHENDFFAAVRDNAGDLAERVYSIDRFKHPKTGKTSSCFRVEYRSMERSLTNKEIDEIQDKLRSFLKNEGYELR